MKAGYKVARPGTTDGCSIGLEGQILTLYFHGQRITEFAVDGFDIVADDWYTVDPPHITGELRMTIDPAVMS